MNPRAAEPPELLQGSDAMDHETLAALLREAEADLIAEAMPELLAAKAEQGRLAL